MGVKTSKEVKDRISAEMKARWEAGVYKDNGPKIASAKLGSRQPESQKLKVSIALSKTYIITDPFENEFKVTNLTKWCRENNMHAGNMCSVAKGKLRHYKGYKVRKFDNHLEDIE